MGVNEGISAWNQAGNNRKLLRFQELPVGLFASYVSLDYWDRFAQREVTFFFGDDLAGAPGQPQ